MSTARESRPTGDRDAAGISGEGSPDIVSGTADSAPRSPQVRARRAPRPFPLTSRLAYGNATADANAVRAAIIALLSAHGPMTDDETTARYHAAGHPPKSRQRIGTARCELVKLGRVQDSGERRPSAMGNPAKVWEVTPT